MDINELREKIDVINNEMQRLFDERMRVSAEIARYKRENGLPVIDRERERAVIHRAVMNSDEAIADYTRAFFTSVMNLSRSYQATLMPSDSGLATRIDAALDGTSAVFTRDATVACQGVEGSYSSVACDKLFPSSDILYFPRFENVFSAVEKGLCRYGILPIENSSHGSVGEVYDLMKKHNFHIVRSVRIKVDHVLVAKKGVKLSDVREIISHEQALGQCGQFLSAHPDIKIGLSENTAIAARTVAESDRTDIAAIASRATASIYGLDIIESGISNVSGNYTRFICISHALEIYPGSNRISFMMNLPHVPGSLGDLLTRFSSLGLNLTKLESRPVPGSDFEFMFYFDIMASITDPNVKNLVCSLAREYERFALLGCYCES